MIAELSYAVSKVRICSVCAMCGPQTPALAEHTGLRWVCGQKALDPRTGRQRHKTARLKIGTPTYVNCRRLKLPAKLQPDPLIRHGRPVTKLQSFGVGQSPATGEMRLLKD